MKITLKQAFRRENCIGWIWGKGNKWDYQNSNDLGLINLVECCPEKIEVRNKIFVCGNKYIYEFEDNGANIQFPISKQRAIKMIKKCYEWSVTDARNNK